MSKLIALFVVVAVLCGPPEFAPGTSASAQPPDSGAFTASATAILVDVVVRDRNGAPVVDLTADDFALLEDGVVQKIDSFTRVTKGGGIGIDVKWRKPSNTLVIAGNDDAVLEEPPATAAMDSTTALVFDHLSSDALALVQNATLGYVPANGDSETSVAVFATDPGFRVIQGYTTDRSAIRNAVRRVLPAGTSAADRTADRRDQLVDRQRVLNSEMSATSAGAGTLGPQAQNEIGSRESELQLLRLERSMIESFDAMDRDQRGYGTTGSLSAIVRTLVERPGRKSIVFFSEGLPVSPALAARLDTLIDMANRANITVYAIDARGLRTKSSLTEARKELQSFVDDRLVQLSSGTTPANRPMMRDFERVEDTVRLDTRVGLARLSSDTGGFLIDGSNDLSNAFRKIDEDNRFHYLLTYSPRKALGDGKFRAIQVKVTRPGATVFSRKGYRAVAAPRNVDALGFEEPALSLLRRAPLPNAFHIGAAAFSFPDPQHPGTVPIVVSLATESIRFDIDPARSTYSAQVGVVVRIKDSHGQPVERLSQQYILSGGTKEIEAAKRGEILFYRQPELKPGVYTVEAVAMDLIANQGSVRVSTLTVPVAQPSAVEMSSLVLVDRTETVADAPPAAGGRAPLYVGQTLIYPNVGRPIRKSATPELPFYFALYGDVRHVKEGSVQLLRNGRAIAEGPLTLTPGDKSPLQHVGRLQIGDLPPGTYELRVRVVAADRELSRTAFFTLLE